MRRFLASGVHSLEKFLFQNRVFEHCYPLFHPPPVFVVFCGIYEFHTESQDLGMGTDDTSPGVVIFSGVHAVPPDPARHFPSCR